MNLENTEQKGTFTEKNVTDSSVQENKAQRKIYTTTALAESKIYINRAERWHK